jgi:cell division protein FtsI/penicillin-binding protein 2
VVTDGTAKKFQEAPVMVAAKTGTSQAGGGIKAQIAWAAGFFPYDNPEIAFVFMIEGKEGLNISSTDHAVPVALDTLNIYFKKNKAPSQMAVNRTP